MIPVSAQTVTNGTVRVWLATGQTDMRNYVERVIMRSPRRQVIASHGFL
jgi:hypothetical protein